MHRDSTWKEQRRNNDGLQGQPRWNQPPQRMSFAVQQQPYGQGQFYQSQPQMRAPTSSYCSDLSTSQDARLNPVAAPFQPVQAATSHAVENMSSYRATSIVVPVRVASTKNTSNRILVYAMLDTQSDTTFIRSDIAHQLGLAGTDVQLRLSTMTAEDKLVQSERIEGITVQGLSEDEELLLDELLLELELLELESDEDDELRLLLDEDGLR